jgi:preprotein translocase subunit SecE
MIKIRPYKFYEQVKQECKKIFWPTRKELVTSVIIVLVAVFLFSIATLVLDYGIHGIINYILNIGK